MLIDGREYKIYWCNDCDRYTLHRLLAERTLAYCVEHGTPEFSKKQLADMERRAEEKKNPLLFE